MTYFLKEARRTDLQHNLKEIDMPEFIAATLSNKHFSEDNIQSIESFLIERTNMLLKWADSLANAAIENNETAQKMFSLYIMADMMILSAYTDECKERGFLHKMPTFTKAVEAAYEKSGQIKDRAIQGMSDDEAPTTRH